TQDCPLLGRVEQPYLLHTADFHRRSSKPVPHNKLSAALPSPPLPGKSQTGPATSRDSHSFFPYHISLSYPGLVNIRRKQYPARSGRANLGVPSLPVVLCYVFNR